MPAQPEDIALTVPSNATWNAIKLYRQAHHDFDEAIDTKRIDDMLRAARSVQMIVNTMALCLHNDDAMIKMDAHLKVRAEKLAALDIPPVPAK